MNSHKQPEPSCDPTYAVMISLVVIVEHNIKPLVILDNLEVWAAIPMSGNWLVPFISFFYLFVKSITPYKRNNNYTFIQYIYRVV